MLLDTQVVLWWLSDDPRLGATAKATLDSGRESLAVSVVSLWEAALKHATGRLEGFPELRVAFSRLPVTSYPVRVEHVDALVDLPLHHRDPFDRILVATARAEGLTLMTADEALGVYEVPLVDARR